MFTFLYGTCQQRLIADWQAKKCGGFMTKEEDKM